MACENKNCLCQEVEPKPAPPMGKADTAAAYRTAGTKLNGVYDAIERLIDAGHGNLAPVLTQLHKARAAFDSEHVQTANAMGFKIKGGIGPGDWK